MDTTSNALARILDLLSEHPVVQERLRQEVAEAFAAHGDDLDYDTLNGLPFLEAVVRESLR
jgi:cytochrome P450